MIRTICLVAGAAFGVGLAIAALLVLVATRDWLNERGAR